MKIYCGTRGFSFFAEAVGERGGYFMISRLRPVRRFGVVIFGCFIGCMIATEPHIEATAHPAGEARQKEE